MRDVLHLLDFHWVNCEAFCIKEMEKLVDNSKAKTIGLSNFNKTQIVEILSIPGIKHRPAVLQNESHPYLQEKDLRDFCRVSGIAFQVSCLMIIRWFLEYYDTTSL